MRVTAVPHGTVVILTNSQILTVGATMIGPRSTGAILSLAFGVIRHNDSRAPRLPHGWTPDHGRTVMSFYSINVS